MWHYHATSPRHCQFKRWTPILTGELCPKCGRPFATVWRKICNGCNTVYYSDDSHNIGDKFDCPINGEPVELVKKSVSKRASNPSSKGIRKTDRDNRGYRPLSIYIFAAIAILGVMLQVLNIPSLILSVLLFMVTSISFFLMMIIVPLIFFYFSDTMYKSMSSKSSLNTNGSGSAHSSQNIDILSQTPKINPPRYDEVNQYIDRSRRIILNQRIIIFALVNVIAAIGFTCYVPTHVVTVEEVRFIGVKTFQIGSTSTIIFASIFYAGKFFFEIDEKLRRSQKIIKTLALAAIFGISTVITLELAENIGIYIESDDGMAVAIAVNVIADTCIAFEETLVRFYLERIRRPIVRRLSGNSINSTQNTNKEKEPQTSSKSNFLTLLIVIMLAMLCLSAIVVANGRLSTPSSLNATPHPTILPTPTLGLP